MRREQKGAYSNMIPFWGAMLKIAFLSFRPVGQGSTRRKRGRESLRLKYDNLRRQEKRHLLDMPATNTRLALLAVRILGTFVGSGRYGGLNMDLFIEGKTAIVCAVSKGLCCAC